MALLTTTSTEGTRPFEVMLSCCNGTISHDTGTLISGQNCVAGTVLGKITASGKYTLHNNAASDGSEVAAAVLLAAVDASAADARALVLTRLCEVKGVLLTWKSGISAPDKAAGIVALAVNHIIVR